jgi:hypothetical protein
MPCSNLESTVSLRAPVSPATAPPYIGTTRLLAAFAHSPEYARLRPDELAPDYVTRLLCWSEELWLAPDDITGSTLIELLHDMPRIQPYQRRDISIIIRQFRGFFRFAGRECGFPHADECLRLLRREAGYALECSLQTLDRESADARRPSRQLFRGVNAIG